MYTFVYENDLCMLKIGSYTNAQIIWKNSGAIIRAAYYSSPKNHM